MSSSAIDLMQSATIVASSYDSTSDECLGGLCRPTGVSDNGNGQQDNDLSQWQTANDTTCSNQWLQATFNGYSTVSSFWVQYGDLPTTGDLTVTLNPTDSSPVAVAASQLSCVTSTTTDVDMPTRVDTCTFVSPQVNVDGITFTWSFAKNPTGCQMNVEEISVSGSALTASPSSSASSSLSPGAIAGIAVGCVVAAVAVGVAAVRARGIYLRKKKAALQEESVYLH
ncbi:hypothetical protein HDU82_008203 [Entophlyctis luteolus]|nr:hypothetical protein HDU82_008203 [Entophlyctis luteolus]